MLRSRFCDYNGACIFIKGTKTMIGSGANDNEEWTDERNKAIIFKNCAPFTDCISEIRNTRKDNSKDMDVVMPMNDLI